MTPEQRERGHGVTDLTIDTALLCRIEDRIRAARTRAAFAVDAELIRLYWEFGRLLERRQSEAGWGAAVIPMLAGGLANELPEVEGFSLRDLDRMVAFARAYPQPADFSPRFAAKADDAAIAPQAVPKSVDDDSLLWLVPWGHHALLLAKVGPVDVRVYRDRLLLRARMLEGPTSPVRGVADETYFKTLRTRASGITP